MHGHTLNIGSIYVDFLKQAHYLVLFSQNDKISILGNAMYINRLAKMASVAIVVYEDQSLGEGSTQDSSTTF